MPLFRHTLFAANQPACIQRHRHTARNRLAYRNWHSQQHVAVIAIVGHIAHCDFYGRWPLHLTRMHTRGQLPIKRGCHACVARVFPITVPVRGMRKLQAQP